MKKLGNTEAEIFVEIFYFVEIFRIFWILMDDLKT